VLFGAHVIKRGLAPILIDLLQRGVITHLASNGAATIHVLRRINPSIRIIAASGIDSRESITRDATPGGIRFLTKPYSAETLLRLLREVLDEPAASAAN